MLRIALCDDDRAALPVIAGAAESAFEAQGVQAKVDCFLSGKELLQTMQEKHYQIILMDIEMPQIDGIELGRKIRKADNSVEIIYVSECEDRVFESFAVYPLGFVRKSNFLNDIAGVVKLYIRKHAKSRKEEQLKFITRSEVRIVRSKKIQYIEGCGNYQMVFLTGEKDPIEVKMTMDKLEEMTEDMGFIRIHKGYLVNVIFIKRIQSNQVIMNGDVALPIGRSRIKEVKSRYISLLES